MKSQKRIMLFQKCPVYYPEGEDTPAYPIQASKIFCSGHCFLPNGKLFVAGGELNNPYPDAFEPTAPDRGLRYSFIFDPDPDVDPGPPDPATDYWSITGLAENPHIMAKGRWYPTLTLLHNGTVLCMAGLTDEVVSNPYSPADPPFIVLHNRIPEIYTPSGNSEGWASNLLVVAQKPVDVSYSYPDAHVIPIGDLKGKVFYASTQLVPNDGNPTSYTEGYSQIFDPFASDPDPYWTAIENKRTSPSEASAGVLLPIRKYPDDQARVIITGGRWDGFLNRIDLIDLSPAEDSPLWESAVQEMRYARADHNAVILPDRSLLIIGGVNSGGSVLTPELLDTDTMEWISQELLPDMPVARHYHSTAILLPDGRVLLGGGRVSNGGDVEDDTERRFSIYKPQYLLEGGRPVITDAPDEISYEDTFEITLDGIYQIDSICLMKPGAVTHGNNMDQRYIELNFTQGGSLNEYVVETPDAYKAPPGYYMLFVLKDKTLSTSGDWKIPSVAKFVKLNLTS